MDVKGAATLLLKEVGLTWRNVRHRAPTKEARASVIAPFGRRKFPQILMPLPITGHQALFDLAHECGHVAGASHFSFSVKIYVAEYEAAAYAIAALERIGMPATERMIAEAKNEVAWHCWMREHKLGIGLVASGDSAWCKAALDWCGYKQTYGGAS